ncbi:MAG TPA: DNA repair protein RadA [Bacteroidales bacterium]|nr:DNA repair protein RadA [Bacteroidales bacterium]HPR58414.1 DNA repair protein RadA [Bacteroidales bacterium]HRW96803.1 DNA repair protein RadA [Bacteroidales bacterium]
MAKTKTVFFCQNCGYQSPKWIGNCPSCGAWNSFVEELVVKNNPVGIADRTGLLRNKPKLFSSIEAGEETRMDTRDKELNRVLGGGLVTGSVILVGGEPGIGKSTLMLQLALQLSSSTVLYVSGEESDQQIKMRAERLGSISEHCYVFTETSLEEILIQIENVKPEVIIIDSIQTLSTSMIESSAGSVSQIRECTNQLQKYAKLNNIPVFLVGHITKDGNIAGPKILEHIVDTVLYFEGDRNYGYRILRAVKNRFGSAQEIGIYEMHDTGLRQVTNPSELLLSQRDENLSGIAIAATVEGLRPMLIETQALVSTAAYGVPQRSATGFDARRLNMLLAVLEKRAGFKLAHKDVFLNIAGGIRVDDPATDLAVVCAILSSSEDIPVNPKVCFAAEVGLSGEIRGVNRIGQRIGEAAKLGFEKIFVSGYGFKKSDIQKPEISIIPVSRIEEVFRLLFG